MNLIMVLGYLASGKTTFIINALNSLKNNKNAVVVNDFGSRDVDGILLNSKNDIVEKIYDGSIFCSCKSDKFVEAMLNVISKNPDNIIVEASGLANPYSMFREIELIEQKSGIHLDLNVFCIIDVLNYEKILQICHSIKMQTALCDVAVLNKIDLVDDVTTSRVEKLVSEITKAKIIKTTGAKLDKYFGYKVIKKPEPKLIQDITVQKLLIGFTKSATKKELDFICKKISEVSNRIKGIVNFDSEYYIYEYINGTSKIVKTNKTECFLVVLSSLKSSLKNNVLEIINNSSFLELK